MRTAHVTTAVLIGILGLTAIGIGAIRPGPAEKQPPTPGGLIVHEWGTFSSFSGSDGKLERFKPANTDLPDFVHNVRRYWKGALDGFVSLETPVVYFYSEKELTATVSVDFPKGTLTEWYPEAATHKSECKGLVWNEIRLLPGKTPHLPVLPKENHYYAARATDATPLEVNVKRDGKPTREEEKFLFYRGVGNCATPLTLTAQGHGLFAVKNSGTAPLTGLVLIQVRGHELHFRELGDLAGGATISAHEPDGTASRAELSSTLIRLLTKAGLYEKEARAMVNTWSSVWFGDEGTRVLYILPPAWTDATLPLQVTPKPDALVRVLVGRHDILTPEGEQRIDEQVRSQKEPRAIPNEVLTSLGRFATPAWQAAVARTQRKVPSRAAK